jgi:hypothetical protein
MNVHLLPTLNHVGLDISRFDQIDRLVSPSGFTSMICDRAIRAFSAGFPLAAIAGTSDIMAHFDVAKVGQGTSALA